jgi:hypothetical protein
MTDRGQTVYDFLLGVVLFLVVVVSVFAIFPDIFEPFFDPSPGERDEMADRVANELIENASVPDEEQTLRYEQLNDTLESVDGDTGALKNKTGVSEFRNIQVELRNSGTAVKTWGKDPQNVWSTTVRNVRVSGRSGSGCKTVCRLIVKVW